MAHSKVFALVLVAVLVVVARQTSCAASGTLGGVPERARAGRVQVSPAMPFGRLYALESGRAHKQPLALLPGLLDETLLSRGSFSFGAKQVAFNKLKVLGNVYVNRVNGRPLRESYLFRSATEANGGAPMKRPQEAAGKKVAGTQEGIGGSSRELRIQIVKK